MDQPAGPRGLVRRALLAQVQGLVHQPWCRPRPSFHWLCSIDSPYLGPLVGPVRSLPFPNQSVRSGLRSGGRCSRQRRPLQPRTVWLCRLTSGRAFFRLVTSALGHFHRTRGNKHQTSRLPTERQVDGRISKAFAANRSSPNWMAQPFLKPPFLIIRANRVSRDSPVILYRRVDVPTSLSQSVLGPGGF